jgi:uncharacterized membrane protein
VNGFYVFLVKSGVTLYFFIYQVSGAVWAVHFSAFADFAIAFAAGFLLGAAVAVS